MPQKPDKTKEKSRRIRERVQLTLPVRVLRREAAGREWIEMSRLLDVTPFGARLALKRPIEIGRLLHLTMPMPRQLRVFDHAEDQYRTWSLVRNVKLLNRVSEADSLLHVGVAFIGRRPPRSFESDPTCRYEITKSASESVWSIKEGSEDLLVEVAGADKRKESRHNIPIEVLIEVLDETGVVTQTEKTVTENVSRRGASVFTSLPLSRGRFVTVTSEQYQTFLLAVVRGLRSGTEGVSRLHLEFVGKEWPLDF